MNRKVSAWLPPDGDSRLIRFQQDLAVLCGRPDGLACPPHLALDRLPEGPITAGLWTVLDADVVRQAFDTTGPVGVFRWGLADSVLSPRPLASLPTPDWSWRRGVTAVLEWEDLGESAVWRWTNRRGWRALPPTP